MAPQHKIVFLILLSQSFFCIGMENPNLELIIQEMRAYGDNIQKDCITFAQKTNSSFDRLKPAKKQNIYPQNAIAIEQPKRFKTSTQQQEDEIIDVNAFFQKEQTKAPNILQQALQQAAKKKNINTIEKSGNQIDLPHDPAQRDLNELQEKLHNKHKLESNKDYDDWLKEEEKKLQDSFKNIPCVDARPSSYASLYQPPYMSDIETENFFLFKAILSEHTYDHETYGRAYTEHCKNMLQKQQPLQKKAPVEKLSDEPDVCDNCFMCVAGTTFWAGMAWGLKVLSQVK
jgi:hypothetical protein